MSSRRCPLGRVVAVAVSLLAAACGTGRAAVSSSADFAVTNSAGDKLTEAAIRRDAGFTCPSAAANAGVTGRPLASGHKMLVATTVAPITSIVANVAGDRAQVNGVIPEGQDSHTFEPKPSVAELFSKADVVFVNGLSLEDPTKDIAVKSLSSRAELVELGPIVVSPDEWIYDFSFPRDGGKPNPHLWTNPPMAACYAVIAASVLSKADPVNAAYYEANAAKLEAKIDDLSSRFKAASAKMAANERELLTYHDAYAYFAAYYRWKIIGAIQVSSFEDPTPKEVAALIEQIKREKVPAIFGSEVFPTSVLAQIGKEAHVKYVDKLRDDDLPGVPGNPDHSYLGLMKADLLTIVSNLNGDASALSSFDASDVTTDKAVYPQ